MRIPPGTFLLILNGPLLLTQLMSVITTVQTGTIHILCDYILGTFLSNLPIQPPTHYITNTWYLQRQQKLTFLQPNHPVLFGDVIYGWPLQWKYPTTYYFAANKHILQCHLFPAAEFRGGTHIVGGLPVGVHFDKYIFALIS